MSGIAAISGNSVSPKTLSERIDLANNQMESQLDRIEGLLARVNSTPQQDSHAVPAPLNGLANCVDRLEGQVNRLQALTQNLHSIA